jgi:KDO2-lipid IV(A) lauroyltransferase
VASLFKLLAGLPGSWAEAFGVGAGRLVYRLDARHRRVAQENLARAFAGALSGAELSALAQAVFEHLGRTAVDVARSAEGPEAPGGWQVDGIERLRAARARGKGVLVLTAHFGPWELLPVMAARLYEPIHVVARPMDNPWVDDFVTALRERGGNHVIKKRDALASILKVLRQGDTVGMLIDQHIDEEQGVVVPFFGRPASTVAAPALLAIRSGAAVLPAVILREGRARYRVRIAEEVALVRTADLKTDLAVNTARFTAALERLIRERPEQWFWVHRRWKTPMDVDERLKDFIP